MRSARSRRPPSIISPAPRTSAQSWQHTFETYEVNVLAHPSPVRRAAPRGREAARAHRRLRDHLRAAGSPDSRRRPGWPRRVRTRRASSPRSCWRGGPGSDDGVPTLLARSFNHIGPRQSPAFVAARHRAEDRADRSRPRGAGPDAGQSGAAARPHRRARHGARLRRDDGASDAGAPVQRLLRPRAGHPRVGRDAAQAARGATSRSPRTRSLFRPNDPPLLVGDHARLTADTGWTPQMPFEQTVDDLLAYWRSWANAKN